MSEEGARLLEELMQFRPDGLTANGWAVKAGVSRTIWADLKRHGNPSRRTLEKLLGAAGSSLAEFEALRVGHAAEALPGSDGQLADPSRGWRGTVVTPIPLLETRSVGKWGEAGSGIEWLSIDRAKVAATVDRPTVLAADGDAYAVTMVGESMWPRFRARRQLLVSPAASIAVGDDVLVRLAGDEALIGELVRRTADRIELRQFNPDKIFPVDATKIAAMHKVMGEAI